jgi:hypothetical protein
LSLSSKLYKGKKCCSDLIELYDNHLSFFKQAILMRRSTVLNFFIHLVFPGGSIQSHLLYRFWPLPAQFSIALAWCLYQGIFTEGERINTVGLLVLTYSHQLLFKIDVIFFSKQVILMRRSTVLGVSLQLVFPGWFSIAVSWCLYQGILTKGERINTVYLLVLTTSDELFSKWNHIFLFPKQAVLIRRWAVLSVSLQ